MGARERGACWREFKEVLQATSIFFQHGKLYGVGQLPEVIGRILSSPRFLFSRVRMDGR